MSLTADLHEVDRLVGDLDDVAGRLVDVDQPAGIIADDLVAAAQPVTPYDRGNLVKTVRATVVAGDVILVAGGTGVDYAGPVHARQPWLADTVTRQLDQAVDTLTDHLTDIVGTIEG